jgi:probable dihydroxyacetone kinase regulator
MAIKNSTKQAFADALKSLLAAKELSAVRVQELCRICGAERPTFYYHFRDKYDLVSWIYEQDLQKSVRLSGEPYGVNQLEQLLLILQADQTFYRKAFHDSGQNALLSYILQSNIRLAREVLGEQQALVNLTREEEFQIRVYTYAWCGCLQDWISGRYDFSAEKFYFAID